MLKVDIQNIMMYLAGWHHSRYSKCMVVLAHRMYQITLKFSIESQWPTNDKIPILIKKTYDTIVIHVIFR